MFPTLSHNKVRTDNWRIVAALLGGVLLLYYVVPLISLLGQPPGTIIDGLLNENVIRAAVTSSFTALMSTFIATLFGIPLAYWLARAQFRGQSIVTAIVVLPLVLPPIVSGMVLLSLFGPSTSLGTLASAAGFPLTRSFIGIVLAQTFVASPFVVITAKAAFEGIDRQLEYASRTLGKDSLTTFRSVSLPLAKPGIIAGITLAFARAIGEFGATIMMAYYPRTMPVQIWLAFMSSGIDAAFPVSIILLLLSFGALSILTILGKNPWE